MNHQGHSPLRARRDTIQQLKSEDIHGEEDHPTALEQHLEQLLEEEEV